MHPEGEGGGVLGGGFVGEEELLVGTAERTDDSHLHYDGFAGDQKSIIITLKRPSWRG